MLGGEHFTQRRLHDGHARLHGARAGARPARSTAAPTSTRSAFASIACSSRELPFKADTAIAMAQKQVADAPTPIRDVQAKRPAVVRIPDHCKALSKSPADRSRPRRQFRATTTDGGYTGGNLDDMPTMATPTALDLTLPQPSKVFPPVTGQADLRGTALTASSGLSAAPSPSGATAAPATAPVERTGSSVVLGPKHLVSLGALLALLIAAIAVVGFVAFKRNNAGSQTAVTPPAATVPEAASTPAPAPDQQPTAVTGAQPPHRLPPIRRLHRQAFPRQPFLRQPLLRRRRLRVSRRHRGPQRHRQMRPRGKRRLPQPKHRKSWRPAPAEPSRTTAAGRTASPSTEAGGPRGHVQGRQGCLSRRGATCASGTPSSRSQAIIFR